VKTEDRGPIRWGIIFSTGKAEPYNHSTLFCKIGPLLDVFYSLMLYILRLLRSSNNLGLDWRDRQWPLKAKLRETTVNTDQENRGTRRGTKKGPPTPVVKTWLLKGADQTGRAKIPSSGDDSELQRLWWWGPEKVASMNGLNAVAEVGKDGNSKEAEMRRP
jgi:hypothetical protein